MCFAFKTKLCSKAVNDFIMTSLCLVEDNDPIVAYSLHIQVGVGFPCLDRALLTSCKACS